MQYQSRDYEKNTPALSDIYDLSYTIWQRKEGNVKHKPLMVLFALAALLVVFRPVKANAADVFKYNSNGTVTVTYESESGKEILVIVENTDKDKSATKYYYKVYEGVNVMIVPLTEGTGTYKIRLCRLLSNNKATILKTWSTEFKSGEEDVFKTSNVIVDYPLSKEAMDKAESLTKKSKTDADKVKKIYSYIIKNFAYDYERLKEKTSTSYYVPSIQDTYTRKLGICYDISSILVGMLRTVGVESRVVTGYTPNVSVYHAWTQVYDSESKEWYTLDATYDMCMYNQGVKTEMKKKYSEYKDISYKY